jgi:hypothetical protein
MSFTKAALISQALIRVEGGAITSDSDVRWGEMETYLSMAVNYVMVGQYWAENKAEGGHNINPLLYTVFENIAIQTDSTTSRKYFTLPKNLITLPKARALEVNTMCGKMCFPLTQGDNALEQYYGKLKKSISYFPEGQLKVWLYNVPALVTAIRTKQWVHVQDLADTDLVILPSDGDTKVVDLMVQFFTGERQMPKDYTQDSQDN